MSTTDKAKWNLFAANLTTQIGGDVDYLSSSITFIDNEPGVGDVKLALDDTLVSSMTPGTFLRCSYRGAVRGGFFVENIHQVDADQNENEGRVYSVNGRGLLSKLDTFHVLNDAPSQVNATRTFTNTTKAGILIQLITEAQSAGALSVITYDFDADFDSDGAAWADNENLDIPVGKKILDVVREFSKAGDFNIRASLSGSNILLSVYKDQIGNDLSSGAPFRIGSNCEEATKDLRGGKELVNEYLFKYKGGYGTVQDSASIAANGLNADFLNLELAQSEESARTFAAAKLSLNKDPKESKGIKVFDGIAPNVFLDYTLGDTIAVDRFGEVTSDRILSMQLDFSKESYADVFIDFNYIFLDNDIKTNQQLEDLLDQWSTAHDANLIETSKWLNMGLPNGNVNASFIYNNELYVFGNFTSIGNIGATRAAKYNLSTGVWSALSTGISAEVLYATIIGTTIYATTLTTVNKYVGGVWSVIGTVTLGEIRCIATDGVDLVVGGSFLAAAGLSSDKVARWNGSSWLNTYSTPYDCLSLCYFGGLGNPHFFASLYTGVNTECLQFFSAGSWHILFSTEAKICGGMGTDGTWLYYVLASNNHVVRYDGAGLTYDEDLGDLGFTPVLGIISGIIPTPYKSHLTDVYIGRIGVSIHPNGIVKYSGNVFSDLGTGAITSGNIRTISIADNGDVYIGGSYIGLNSQPINYLNVYVTDYESLADHLANDVENSFDLGGTIHSATAVSITDTGEMGFWDSVTSSLRKITWANIKSTFMTALGGLIAALTGKTTPADGDYIVIADSAASNATKSTTFSNLKAFFKTYFDGFYRVKLTANTTYYIRTDGSDSNNGLTNSAGGAFLTAAKAIQTLQQINLNGYIATLQFGAGTWNEDVTFQNINGVVTIVGTLTSLEAVTSATVAAGSGATQGTVTKTGQFTGNNYAGKLCYFVTDAAYRIIDSNTNDVLTLVGQAPSSTTQNITVYDWGTIIDGGSTGHYVYGQTNLTMQFLDMKSSYTNGITVFNTDTFVAYYCYFDGGLTLGSGSNSIINRCSVLKTTSVVHGGTAVFYGCKLLGSTTTTIVSVTRSAYCTLREGAIVDGGVSYGVFVSENANFSFSNVSGTGYCRVRNCNFGVRTQIGGVASGLTNTVYSSNSTDESSDDTSGGNLSSAPWPVWASGTYTPTLTNSTNIASSTAHQCQWLRVGSVVTVSGSVDIDPTAAGVTILGMTFPVASNIGNAGDCAGVCSCQAAATDGSVGVIVGDVANDRATFSLNVSSISTNLWYFTFTYRII